jgi:hypothetical protein
MGRMRRFKTFPIWPRNGEVRPTSDLGPTLGRRPLRSMRADVLCRSALGAAMRLSQVNWKSVTSQGQGELQTSTSSPLTGGTLFKRVSMDQALQLNRCNVPESPCHWRRFGSDHRLPLLLAKSMLGN